MYKNYNFDVGVCTQTKRQNYWERPEYWEESWRLEETCSHLHSSERPSAYADVNNSNELIIIKKPGGLGSWRTGRDYPNDSIAKNDQNPETSSGDLRRLAVTQTPVKNHQQTLMWKTLIIIIMMMMTIIIIIIINFGQKTRPNNNQQKKENLQNCRFCYPG